jgi:hypothetical protein
MSDRIVFLASLAVSFALRPRSIASSLSVLRFPDDLCANADDPGGDR